MLQEKNGITEAQWKGNLDQPAISALKNGRQVVLAVQDTITSVEGHLRQAIAATEEHRIQSFQQEELRKQQVITDATISIETATSSLNHLTEELRAFKQRYPQATRDIANPNLSAAQRAIKDAQQALVRKDYTAVTQLAKPVEASIKNYGQALAIYPAGASQIEDLEKVLATGASHKFFSAAEKEWKNSKQLLDEANQAYVAGDSRYLAKLQDAANKSQQTLSTMDKAHAKEITKKATKKTLFVGGLLVALGGLTLQGHRATKKRTEAQQYIAKWETLLEKQVDAVLELQSKHDSLIGTSFGRYEGKTEEVINSIMKDMGSLFTIQCAARKVLEQAKVLCAPSAKTFFSANRAVRALRLLKDTPIEFSPDTVEELELAVRGKLLKRQAFTSRPEDLESFKASFNDLMTTAARNKGRAEENLDAYRDAVTGIGNELTALQEKAEALQVADEQLATGTIATPALKTKFLPAVESAIAEGQELAKNDPLFGNKQLAKCNEFADHALNLAALLQTDGLAVAEESAKVTAYFKGQGVSGEWMKKKLHDTIITPSDNEFAFLAALTGPIPCSTAKSNIASFRDDLSKAQEFLKIHETELSDGITATQKKIGKLTQAMAATLKLSPETVLSEEGRNPSESLSQGTIAAAKVITSLSLGDLKETQAQIEAVRAALNLANTLTDQSETALDEFGKTHASFENLHAELVNKEPAYTTKLSHMRANYADMALLLQADDPKHPRANDKIDDNIQEICTALSGAKASLEKAVLLKCRGEVLAANDELKRASVAHDFADLRYTEIDEKQVALDKCAAKARETLDTIHHQVNVLTPELEKHFVRADTILGFEDKTLALKAYEDQASRSRPNPYALAEQAANITKAFRSVERALAVDQELYRTAGQTLSSVERSLKNALSRYEVATHDDIPDSRTIVNLSDTFKGHRIALGKLNTCYATPHQDWESLDAQTNALSSAIHQTLGALNNEMEAANKAIKTIDSARAGINQAQTWRGKRQVTISGSPGRYEMNESLRALEVGNYVVAIEKALRAKKSVKDAICEAEAKVAKILKREAEEESERQHQAAIEAANRRNTESNYSSLSPSAWSSGSGSSSSSWGNSSSGTQSSNW